MAVQPFEIKVDQAILDDVQARLAQTRWPDEVRGADWSYGTNLAYLKKLATYWRDGFDWRAQEAALNRFAHFRADIDGLNIHFIHERGKGANPMPILLTHGWPDSFYRMVKLIPLLTDPAAHGGDPADSFDVIVPSMPGFGFSDSPTAPGMTVQRVADTWARLMNELGYQHYAAHGGDIGGGVTQRLAMTYADKLIGIHLTDVNYPYFSQRPTMNLTEAEQKYVQASTAFLFQEGAYAMMQATKPQTLAYGLNDSPVGLAAWLVEKFRAWSDCNGDVESVFSKDELLTNISIYWAKGATGAADSTNRIYYEEMHNPTPPTYDEHSDVPTAVALFSRDITPAPREWAERTLNVQRWTEMPRGGHFAALEQPQLLADDIRAFFGSLR